MFKSRTDQFDLCFRPRQRPRKQRREGLQVKLICTPSILGKHDLCNCNALKVWRFRNDLYPFWKGKSRYRSVTYKQTRGTDHFTDQGSKLQEWYRSFWSVLALKACKKGSEIRLVRNTGTTDQIDLCYALICTPCVRDKPDLRSDPPKRLKTWHRSGKYDKRPVQILILKTDLYFVLVNEALICSPIISS